MFAYCNNSPTVSVDTCGTMANTFWAMSVLVCDGGYSPYPGKGDGNYYSYDKADVHAEEVTIHRDIPNKHVLGWMETLTKRDYEGQASFFSDIMPGNLDLLFLIGDAVSLMEDPFVAHYDPCGRELKIQEGFTVVVLDRVYIGDGYSASESEYFVFDTEDTLVYNDVVVKSYFFD